MKIFYLTLFDKGNILTELKDFYLRELRMSDEISKFNVRGLGVERLKAIYYVGLTESMTKAGELLGVCQSAVSKQVQSIEDELGVVLFRRGDRKVELTPAGKLIVQLSKNSLYEIDGALKSIKEKQEGLSGSLRILTFPSFASVMIPRYLAGFKEEYPDIDLRIMATFGEMPITEADVVIRPFVAKQPKLKQLHLYQEYLGLYASKDYLKKYGEPKTLEELDDHQLLALNTELETHAPQLNWALKVGVAEKNHFRKAQMYFPTNDALANAVLASLGIASLVKHHVTVLNNPNLIQILPKYEMPKEYICLSFNHDVTHQQKYLALYEYMKKGIELDLNPS